MLPVTNTIAARAEGIQLSARERQIFKRHLLLPGLGEVGQRRLKSARVLIVGAGGLGSPAALYLAAAGVGTLGLVDADRIDITNIQRQILFGCHDIGQKKVERAHALLSERYPELKLEIFDEWFTPTNAAALVNAFDVVVDGSDNLPTRYLAHDAAFFAHKPYVYGSIYRYDGQASVFYRGAGPCYRCLFAAPSGEGSIASCAEAGVLGVLPGMIGVIQATETVKMITGDGDLLIGRLLTYDALSMHTQTLALKRDPNCALCGANPTVRELAAIAPLCLADAAVDPRESEIDGSTYLALRAQSVPHLLLDVRTPSEAKARSIVGSVLMPLATLAEHIGELPWDRPIIVHCHSGARSAQAVRLLRERGLANAQSLRGGIAAWPATEETATGTCAFPNEKA